MPRRTKKPPRPVYHDGLIPATHDTYQSYPEIVPDDHDQIKHEKSYPELAPPQPDPQSQQQQQQQQQSEQQQQSPEQRHHHDNHHPSISTTTGILPPPTAHSTHSHHHHHPLSGFPAGINPSPLSAPPLIHPLPRTSGVHSLRQAWSEVGDDEPRGGDGGRHEFLDEGRPPLWKRPIFWVVVVAGAVIVALAGVLGGVASGGVKTAWSDSSSGKGTTTTSTPSVTNPTCPGSANLNYTSTATTTPKTFRIQCAANYPNGDGDLGLVENAVDSIAGCLDACAQEASCVGAVFSPGDAAKCWLKQFIGVVQTGDAAGGVVSGVLWQ